MARLARLVAVARRLPFGCVLVNTEQMLDSNSDHTAADAWSRHRRRPGSARMGGAVHDNVFGPAAAVAGV